MSDVSLAANACTPSASDGQAAKVTKYKQALGCLVANQLTLPSGACLALTAHTGNKLTGSRDQGACQKGTLDSG